MTPSFALLCIGFGLLLIAAAIWIGEDHGHSDLITSLAGLLGVVLLASGVLSLIVQAFLWAAGVGA